MKHLFFISLFAPCLGMSAMQPPDLTLLAVNQHMVGTPEVGRKIFTTAFEEKQWRLAQVQKDRQQFSEMAQQDASRHAAHVADVTNQLTSVKQSLTASPDDLFLHKKLPLLNERYQMLKDQQKSRENGLAMLQQHSKMLQDYLEDPDFGRFKKELKIGQQTTYTFEDLHTINQLILDQEKNISSLHEQDKNASIELDNRKQIAAATIDAYKKKKESRQSLAKLESYGDVFDLDAQQRHELVMLQDQLFEDTKLRDLLQIKEIEYKKGFLKTELFLAKQQLHILKEIFRAIKPMINVSEADVAYAHDELVKKKQQSLEVKESYRKEADLIAQELREKEVSLAEIARRVNIMLAPDINDWSRTPVKTVSGFLGLFEVGELNDQLLVLQRKRDLLESYMLVEDEKIQHESIHILVKSSFYKIIARKFFSDEEIRQEKKRYDAPLAESQANLSRIKELKSSAQHLIEQQKKALEHCAELRKQLHDLRSSLFKGNQSEHTRCIELLNSAEEKIKLQLDLLSKSIISYEDSLSLLKKSVKQIEFIRSELEGISIWYRPEYAVSWEGIKTIIPNITQFFKDIYAYLKSFSFNEWMGYGLRNPWLYFKLLLALLFIIASAWLNARLIPHVITRLRAYDSDQSWFYVASLFLLMAVGYIAQWYIMLVIWFMALFSLKYYDVADPYAYILFYLVSIPYVIYLAYQGIEYLKQFNSRYHYVFISKEGERRFFLVGSIILYASIALILFRKAFLFAAYYKSEVPLVLAALYVIIVQICLLLLIDKNRVIALIPTNYAWGAMAQSYLDRYYYFMLALLIAGIVLSNPYIGFSKLVVYIFTRILYTLLFLPIIYWIHAFLKEAASPIFFTTSSDGVLKERFDYGKTLYGLFVITLFLLFIFIGGIGLAKIWRWPETFAQMSTWADVKNWLKTPLLLEQLEHPISMFSILKIFSFLFFGFVISYAVNRFILSKIFDVLLIEPGVQNTIASLTSYFIILTSIILGFQAVDLGRIVWYIITALGIGIGWVLKDPIGDFIAYFILLVQRPVKIGDYVTLDDDTKGVVRKITPRSVMIRRKNSTTLIVPNTVMIKRPIANWNYARGFIAFDDILLTVTYQADPALVKLLLEKVLDASPFVLKNPKPIVRLEQFNEFGFVFLIRGFLSSNYTLDQWDIASDIRLEMVKTLRQNDIQFAVPMRIIMSGSSPELPTSVNK